ncbi:MAG: rhomboid family intramembrane serine protease [Lawsonibacter sp.]|nr:rhomboid family intramembrane serine protease [Lawsonibacter sp.]
MNYIVAGNLLVFLLDLFTHGMSTRFLVFSPGLIFRGEIWRLVTFIFVPLSFSPLAFVLSLLFYYYMGSRLEAVWGSSRFTVYYLLGAVLNVIVGLLLALLIPSARNGVTANMTYLNLSLFFAYATLYPDLQVLLAFLIPVKMKWLAWVEAALFAYQILVYVANGQLALALLPVIAIFNYLLFFWDELSDFSRRTRDRAVHRVDPKTINFKRAQREVQQRRGYLHKCAVCGVTDQDDPSMEFRYCSKCNGYYCYCMNHINNHIHVQ